MHMIIALIALILCCPCFIFTDFPMTEKNFLEVFTLTVPKKPY